MLQSPQAEDLTPAQILEYKVNRRRMLESRPRLYDKIDRLFCYNCGRSISIAALEKEGIAQAMIIDGITCCGPKHNNCAYEVADEVGKMMLKMGKEERAKQYEAMAHRVKQATEQIEAERGKIIEEVNYDDAAGMAKDLS